MNYSPETAVSQITPYSTFAHKHDVQPHQFKAASWADLVNVLLRHPERIQKDGPMWSPATYPDGLTRGNENVEYLSAAVCDCDHGETLEAMNELVADRERVIHTTHSHTDAEPRFRIIIPFTRLVAKHEWPEVRRRVDYHVFADAGDDATKDASRAYYLAAHPPGAPFFSQHYPGKAINPDELPSVPGRNDNGHKAEPIPDVIPKGKQHTTLVSLAGTMRRRGMKAEEIDAALQKVNERLEEPAPPKNIAKIAQSVAKYEPAEAQAKPQRPPTQTRWAHADLMAEEFAPVPMIVAGLVAAEGLTFFAAKKKTGKTWLCCQLAIAVASGKHILNRETTKGRVLYFCLEDGVQRLQKRLQDQGAPADLDIVYETRLEPLDGKGMLQLETAILQERPQLVIIDTLAAAKSGKTDENAAGDMADMANALRQIAQDLKVGITVTAHHGKTTHGDPGDDIRGSSAIAAAADVNLGLYKTETGHVLKAEGRDIESVELAISFDANQTWAWQLKGDARLLARSEAEEDVLDVLETLEEADAGAVARELGKSRKNVRDTLENLRKSGKITARQDPKKKAKILYKAVEG